MTREIYTRVLMADVLDAKRRLAGMTLSAEEDAATLAPTNADEFAVDDYVESSSDPLARFLRAVKMASVAGSVAQSDVADLDVADDAIRAAVGQFSRELAAYIERLAARAAPLVVSLD